ncbi:phenoloxidase-activating factor 2-like [Epargyreus clarus]|uniref:phenoloxidase-activating factor 2-like n=1 Tax=Epargyreus clarus TaxID=520877 RepID=UPI003C2F28B6
MCKRGMLLILVAVASLAAAQVQIDPSVIEGIFGKPEVPTTTVAPIYQDDDGENCQCVPYYLCDANKRAIDDPTITGFGQLDIRFGSVCQESTELCCKMQKINLNVIPMEPDSKRLKGCGYRNVNGLDFTVTGGDGDESQFGEFPWVVAILHEKDKDLDYVGVGVLIHPQVVMTGAHIVNKIAADQLIIRAGEWDTKTEKERLPAQERRVSDYITRDDFGELNMFNDMALVRLKEPVQLSDHINVICMPDQDESFDSHTACVANGWGKNKFGKNGTYAVIQKKVVLDMLSHKICNIMLRSTRLGHFFKLDKSFVCTAGKEGKDTCQGDGGAPLVCPMGDNRYKLTGLVSWGIGCGDQDVPAVYTRVALFRQWVDGLMSTWGFDTKGYKV